MKKLLLAIALLAVPSTARADEVTNAPFPAVITNVDFETKGDKYGCQLSTTSDDKIKLRWIPSESSVERLSMRDDKVQGRTTVALTKLAEQNDATVYGYREANVIVLIVPAIESFATITGTGDRMFMQQNCGLGITLVFTKPLSSDEGMGCNTRQNGVHLPGFCGKLGRLDGRVTSTLSYSMSAGLGEGEKLRILLKTRATKPDGTAIEP